MNDLKSEYLEIDRTGNIIPKRPLRWCDMVAILQIFEEKKNLPEQERKTYLLNGFARKKDFVKSKEILEDIYKYEKEFADEN